MNEIDNFIWGPPLLVLLVGTGILLTIRLHLLQIFKLPKALSLIFRAQNAGSGDIDSFKALCTALSATVGTGNIVGVATAIHAGGPGALFWMWMAAFFGMATKYAEGLLAVKYRETDEKGEIAGGPMYYIKNGMGEKYKWLGGLFAFFGVLVAYFGIGTFAQVNSIVDITKMTIGLDPVWTGAILTILWRRLLSEVSSRLRQRPVGLFLPWRLFIFCQPSAFFSSLPIRCLPRFP